MYIPVVSLVKPVFATGLLTHSCQVMDAKGSEAAVENLNRYEIQPGCRLLVERYISTVSDTHNTHIPPSVAVIHDMLHVPCLSPPLQRSLLSASPSPPAVSPAGSIENLSAPEGTRLFVKNVSDDLNLKSMFGKFGHIKQIVPMPERRNVVYVVGLSVLPACLVELVNCSSSLKMPASSPLSLFFSHSSLSLPFPFPLWCSTWMQRVPRRLSTASMARPSQKMGSH